ASSVAYPLPEEPAAGSDEQGTEAQFDQAFPAGTRLLLVVVAGTAVAPDAHAGVAALHDLAAAADRPAGRHRTQRDQYRTGEQPQDRVENPLHAGNLTGLSTHVRVPEIR